MKKRVLLILAVGGLLAGTLPGHVLADEHIGVLENVPTVVAVKDRTTTPDFPVGSLSRADCEIVVHVTAPDGSATEFMSCALSDEPVMVPEYQGSAPETTATDRGGECIWTSDYRFAIDETDVAASAYQSVVTPDGRVFAWSSYPAEPLDCPEE